MLVSPPNLSPPKLVPLEFRGKLQILELTFVILYFRQFDTKFSYRNDRKQQQVSAARVKSCFPLAVHLVGSRC